MLLSKLWKSATHLIALGDKIMKRLTSLSASATLLVLIAGLFGCGSEAKDEPTRKGLKTSDLPQLKADVFAGMDLGTPLTAHGIQGRNTWNIWTGGSQAFLDWLAKNSYGMSDTLRMIDSRARGTRFEKLGLINEPGFMTPSEPDEYGLWLDVPADGHKMGRIDQMIAKEGIKDSVYGRSTGILGLRLYPNPDFNEAAKAKWKANIGKYYSDDNYSMNRELIRPYRVGMACGVCHIAPNPLNPPIDPNEPDWDNLSSAIGNQYFREGAVFASNLHAPADGQPSSFLWEMMSTQPMGTSDTSRMATDHINNPNTINAIFRVPTRLQTAKDNAKAMESMSSATTKLKSFVGQEKTNPRPVPRILKDGSDSIGVAGATIRVYVNIGLFSEQWLTLHKPLVGVRHQEPFSIATAQKNSVFWRATEERLENIATFLSSFQSMPLADAKSRAVAGAELPGSSYLSQDEALLERGKRAFAQECAECHSSKRPPAGLDLEQEAAWFEKSVLSADFLVNNFLSDERRHLVSDIGTNAGRALGTNATRGSIWDNFSSETYKELDAVESIDFYNPLTQQDEVFQPKASKSVGYYRTPSLIAIWTSAPFLHNNSLGAPKEPNANPDPSIKGRMELFEDACQKLLWPDKRISKELAIYRCKHTSAIQVPTAELPRFVGAVLKALGSELVQSIDGVDHIVIGPIPKGMPINLLASLDLGLKGIKDIGKARKLVRLLVKIKLALVHVKVKRLNEDETRRYLKEKVGQELIELSKCPDFVINKGHRFGEDLSDEDKRGIIELLKRM